MSENRVERDSMGEVEIPAWGYWGAQTQRAVENFRISKERIPAPLVSALGLIKKSAAQVNGVLGLLDNSLAAAVAEAAGEVASGQWTAHFPVDVYQTGSGTSWNMNCNEVIANRANELLGKPLGTRSPVHPNDHVNLGQSSNDVIPTAIHIANRLEMGKLLAAVDELAGALRKKSAEFSELVKLGRTHLQDAVPMTLGQEFGAFATQMEKAGDRLREVLGDLEELALGGTAVGTGLNCHPEFAERVIESFRQVLGIPFRGAVDRFEAIAARDAQVALMGAMNGLASAVIKIVNDLRLLSSGPRAALGEIVLPALQPGSSIMPGKVNPVILEMALQVCAAVCGKALSVTIGGQNGPLQLNIAQPLIAYETLSAMDLMKNALSALSQKVVEGISAVPERLEHWIQWSLAMVTPLAAEIGYDKASLIAYEAYRSNRKVAEVAEESGLFTKERLAEILNPKRMV